MPPLPPMTFMLQMIPHQFGSNAHENHYMPSISLEQYHLIFHKESEGGAVRGDKDGIFFTGPRAQGGLVGPQRVLGEPMGVQEGPKRALGGPQGGPWNGFQGGGRPYRVGKCPKVTQETP
jgi:hypothetical protein